MTMPRSKNNRPDSNRSKEHNKALGWGICSVLIGLVAILAALLVEEIKHLPHIAEIGLKLLEHLGIAAIVLGIVSIIVEFRDWQEYFQKRLADIVIERKYLATLDREKLLDLQTDTLKAYFRDENIDQKESFLDFFRTKIQDFIGSPYKEGTKHVKSISLSEDGLSYIVEETLSARNRKVRDSIPDRVEWTTFQDSFIQLKAFSVVIEIPRNFFQSADFRAQYPDMAAARKQFKTEWREGKLVAKDSALQAAKEGQGFILLLNDFKDVDGLYTEVRIKYTLPVNLPLSWTALHSHKELNLIVTYPQDLQIDVQVFGVEENDYHEEDRSGLYTLEYTSWLLPYSGYSFYLREKVKKESDAESKLENVGIEKSAESDSALAANTEVKNLKA